MLAYSSISHAGNMLMAILTMNAISTRALLYYTAAYSVASIASFAVLKKVSAVKNSEDTEVFNGLAKRNPFMAFVITLSLLSMAGIPPLAGFFAKYFIFTSALQSGYVWLVIIAVLGSLIGVYYYFRIIIAMYFAEAKDETHIEIGSLLKAVLILTTALMLGMGLFPDMVMGWL